MDLERLDRINLGVAHGGHVDKITFQQISSLARRFLVEEQKLLDLGKQIDGAIGGLRTLAEDIVNENGIDKASRKMVERYQQRMESIIAQREDWVKAANRQQTLIERLLLNTAEVYKLANNAVAVPSVDNLDALCSYIKENEL